MHLNQNSNTHHCACCYAVTAYNWHESKLSIMTHKYVLQAAADVLGELEEAKEGRSASEAEKQRLHSQLLRLEENAEADLARAADEVSTCFHTRLPMQFLLFVVHGGPL
jgi:type VI protein secretion system component VasF